MGTLSHLPTSQPWERTANETIKAYEAFRTYLDLGANRSAQKTADALGKSHSLMQGWSAKHRWRERAAAWEQWLENERQRAWKEAATAAPDEIAEMNRRHAAMAVALQRKALNALEQLVPGDFDARAILSYLIEAAKLERQARGEPESTADDEMVEQEVVVRLLADPEGRLLAAQLAQRAAGVGSGQNGHRDGGPVVPA